MSTVFGDTWVDWVDPWEGEPSSVTVDMRQPGWRDVVRAKADADAAWLIQDPDILDDMARYGESGPGEYAAISTAEWFNGQSMAIPRDAFRDLLTVKRQRSILQRLYRRYLEQAVMRLVCAHQAERARRSRQHKRRLRQK